MTRTGLTIAALGFFLFAQAAQGEWTASQRLTWTSAYSRNPAIAVDASGRLHVVWNEDTPGNHEIYYKKSTNGGTTWTASQRLTWTSGDSEFPAIAVDASSRLHVVWNDNTPGYSEIYYKKSTDGGATWTTSQRLTWASNGSVCPAIAADTSVNLHVTWQDYASGNAEIYYKKSTNGGTTWTTSQRLTWNSGGSGYPAIAVSSTSNISVVWEDDTPGNYEIYYKKSTNAGTTWTTSQRLTWTSGDCGYPDIAASSPANLHVAWYAIIPGSYEIYYKKSTDGGATWTASQRLTWTSGGSSSPAIVGGYVGNPHVVWNDNTPGNYEIYFKRSTDGGGTWRSSQRLTWSPGSSEASDMAVEDSSGDLHLVWSDATPGNGEIYYKKFFN